MKTYSYRRVGFIFLDFNCNLSFTKIIELKLSNILADLYFVMKDFSLTFTVQLS